MGFLKALKNAFSGNVTSFETVENYKAAANRVRNEISRLSNALQTGIPDFSTEKNAVEKVLPASLNALFADEKPNAALCRTYLNVANPLAAEMDGLLKSRKDLNSMANSTFNSIAINRFFANFSDNVRYAGRLQKRDEKMQAMKTADWPSPEESKSRYEEQLRKLSGPFSRLDQYYKRVDSVMADIQNTQQSLLDKERNITFSILSASTCNQKLTSDDGQFALLKENAARIINDLQCGADWMNLQMEATGAISAAGEYLRKTAAVRSEINDLLSKLKSQRESLLPLLDQAQKVRGLDRRLGESAVFSDYENTLFSFQLVADQWDDFMGRRPDGLWNNANNSTENTSTSPGTPIPLDSMDPHQLQELEERFTEEKKQWEQERGCLLREHTLLGGKISSLQKNQKDLYAHLQAAQQSFEELQDRIDAKEEKIAHLQDELEKKDNASSDASDLRQQLETALAEKGRLMTELSAQTKKIEGIQSELQAKIADMATLQQELKNLQEEVATADKKVQILTEERRQFVLIVKRIDRGIVRKKANIGLYKAAIENLKRRNIAGSQTAAIKEFEKILETLVEEYGHALKEKKDAEARAEGIEQKCSEAESQLETLKKYNENLLQKEKSNQILDVKGLTEAFHKGIKEAATEIDIRAPFLGSEFKSDYFKDELAKALKRGCVVKIDYGLYDQERESKKTRSAHSQSKDTVKNYRDRINEYKNDRRFAPYIASKKLLFNFSDSHGKLFIVDEQYYILSSMNMLSNIGSKSKGKPWEEIGELSTDIENLKVYRTKFFAFNKSREI